MPISGRHYALPTNTFAQPTLGTIIDPVAATETLSDLAGGIDRVVGEWVSARNFGALGDGVADDTAAVQAAVNASVANNLALVFAPGTYLVDNLIIPDNAEYASNPVPWKQRMPRLLGQPGATIRKRAGGSALYLVASANWVNNVTHAQAPVIVSGLVFDAAGIARDAFVNCSYASEVDACHFRGATRFGFHEPATTADGSAMLNGRYGNHYRHNQIYGNGGGGFFVADDPTLRCVISDAEFTGNFIYDNAYNLSISQSAGWIITGNHVWNFGTPPAAGQATLSYIGRPRATTVQGNVFEGYGTQCAGLLLDLSTSGAAVQIIGNQFHTGLGLSATFSGGSGIAMIASNTFTGGDSKIHHGTSDADCEIVSTNNIFESTSPYVFSSGVSHNGVLHSREDRISGRSLILTGRQFPNGLAVQTRPGLAYPGNPPQVVTDTDVMIQRYTSVVGASDAIVTLPTGWRGQRFHFIRGGSAIGAGAIKIRSASASEIVWLSSVNTYAIVEFDGTSWLVLQTGATV